MKEDALLELFYDYLKYEKQVSCNTFDAYKNDLSSYYSFIADNGITDIFATTEDIESFKNKIKDDGRATSSVSRCLSSVRAYYSFLQKNDIIKSNPARGVKNDRSEIKQFDTLTSGEIDTLIGQPSGTDEKSIRDRAILELLYATGLKVSELVALDFTDFNPTLSSIRCKNSSGHKERIIPLYPKIKKLLSHYISNSRKYLVYDQDEKALFVNVNGTRMTRQGLWKIIKQYASLAGINKDITPGTLRHSFATHLLENGADVAMLRDVLGHSDISSTNVYVNFLKRKSSNSLIKFHPHA